MADMVAARRSNSVPSPAPGGFSIWSIDPLGTREPRLLIERGMAQSFAPDGASFVYQGTDRELWIASSDGSEPRRVEGVPGGSGFASRLPAFSADGRSIVFVHSEEGPYGDVWVIPAAGGEARRLTFQGGIDISMGAPVSTSDGFVVFAAARSLSDGPQLWRVPIEGGPVEQLTTGVGGYRTPAISRDGTRALYAHSRPTWRLMRTDLRTSVSTPIYESRTPIVRPAVSFDGRTVAFFSQIPSGIHVFTIDVDGKNLRQRTFDEGGTNTLPAWSHDGSLYYYRDRSLHKLPPTGDSSTLVLEDFHWSSRNFLAIHVDKIAFHDFADRADRHAVIAGPRNGTGNPRARARSEPDAVVQGRRRVARVSQRRGRRRLHAQRSELRGALEQPRADPRQSAALVARRDPRLLRSRGKQSGV